MDFRLTDQQREMVNTVRALAQEKFKPRVKKWQDGTFPFENIKDLAEIGVLGMAVPEEYGGLALPVFDCVLVLEEIAKVCYATSMAVMSAMGAQNRIISVYAPEHVKQKFLPGVVTGKTILGICMTEPHAGTDVANYKTNTVVHNDRVVLNGTKTLIRPCRRGTLLHRVHEGQQQARSRRDRLRACRSKDSWLRGDSTLPYDGWRISRGDPVQQCRTAD